MPSDCILSRDIVFDCTNKPTKGSENRLIVIEKENIDTVTLNNTNKLIVEAMTLASGKRAFEYVGNGMPIATNKSKIVDENGVRWMHNVSFTIEGNTPEIKNELNRFEQKPLVVITKNFYKGDATGKSVYEIFGLDNPVYMEECADEEGNMRWACVFRNKEGYESPTPPHNFFITSLATTEAAVEALLVAGS